MLDSIDKSYDLILEKWKVIVDLINSIIPQLIQKVSDNTLFVSDSELKILKEFLESSFSNPFANNIFFNNNILKNSNEDNKKIFFIKKITYSFIEQIYRFLIKLFSMKNEDIFNIKIFLINILKYFKINDVKVYYYLINELFSILEEINEKLIEILNKNINLENLKVNYLKNYTQDFLQLNEKDFLINFVEINLNDLIFSETLYLNIFIILSELDESIINYESTLCDKLFNLIKLATFCSSIKIDIGILNFIQKNITSIDLNHINCEKYLFFLISLTNRYLSNEDINYDNYEDVLDQSWNHFANCIINIYDDENDSFILLYLVDNLVCLIEDNEKKIEKLFLKVTLPNILNFFFQHFSFDKKNLYYQKSINELLNLYFEKLSKIIYETNNWTDLISFLTFTNFSYYNNLELYFLEPQLQVDCQQLEISFGWNEKLNKTYLFKFYSFLKNSSGTILIDNYEKFIQTLNFCNIVLSSITLLKIKKINYFDIDLHILLKLIFQHKIILEKKNSNLNDLFLNENIIIKIFYFLNFYIKILSISKSSIEINNLFILFLPFKNNSLLFLNDFNNYLDNIYLPKIIKITQLKSLCLNSISYIDIESMHKYQINFFDFILNHEFIDLKDEIENSFIRFMFICYKLDKVKFNKWLLFLIDKKLFTLISLIIGDLCCIVSENCKLEYGQIDSKNEIKSKIICDQCVNFLSCQIKFEEEITSIRLKILQTFIQMIELPDVLTLLANKSSKQFFNHFELTKEILKKIFSLFKLTNLEYKKAVQIFLKNIFESLNLLKSISNEKFLELLYSEFTNDKIRDFTIHEKISCCENIAILCNYLIDDQLNIIIYLTLKAISSNQDYAYYTSIIFKRFVFKNKIQSKDYFLKNKSEICEKALHEILKELDSEKAFQRLKLLFEIFTSSHKDFDILFIESFHIVLPYLIKEKNEQSKNLLTYIISILNFTSFEDLLLAYFESLILYLVRNSEKEQISESFEFIKTLYKIDVIELFSKKGEMCYSLLNEYYNQVRSTNYILSILDSQEKKKPFVDFNSNQQALSNFLSEKMGGYLVNLNIEFLKSVNCKLIKMNLLKSLDLVIKLVSKNTIKNYFEKLISILRTASQCNESKNDQFLFLVQNVWKTLITTSDINEVANNLSIICKNLIDFLSVDSAGISQVFLKLIVQNEGYLGNSLCDIHFIPRNYRLLNSVYHVIDKYVCPIPKGNDFSLFESSLNKLEKSLKIENPEIKYFHYKRLLEIFNENEMCLRNLCLPGNDCAVQPTINRLIKKLFIDSRINDENLRSVIAECLGEIGAIDPGSLDNITLSSNMQNEDIFKGSIKNSDFAILLINKLVAHFDLINESRLQDCINFGLQEVIKCYNVSKTNNEIWDKIQPRSQSACLQLFNSKFTLREKIEPFTYPIFKENRSFVDWIIKWTITLICSVKDKFSKTLFTSLCPLIKYSTSLAQFLLPYIVVFVLKDADQLEQKKIYQEIDYVIANCIPANYNDFNESSPVSKKIIETLFEANSEQYQFSHSIFTLLDSLTIWCKNNKQLLKNSKLKKSNVGSIVDSNDLQNCYESVNKFLILISKEKLSSLAASCRAFTRSLMYLEEYLTVNKLDLYKNYDNFQKLYVELDEPDGVEGIIACRKEEPNLINIILSHEVNGELQEAISCCEKATKLYPKEIIYYKIYLRCLLLLGHVNTAKIVISGLLNQQIKFKNDLQPYLVEAAWKMCDWENLENELNEINTSELTIGLGIGNLLMAIKKSNKEELSITMKKLRISEMNQLSVSSIENSGYTSSYSNLICLHMLNEIEYFYKNYYSLSKIDKKNFDQLIKRCRIRNKIVQTNLRFKEPIINLQRILLNMVSINKNYDFVNELAQLWLSSAKLARKSNNFQKSYNCLLEIQSLEQTKNLDKILKAKIIIEKAKFYWNKGNLEEKEKSLKALNRGIEQLELNLKTKQVDHLHDDIVFAKLHLLYNNYSEKTSNLDSNTLIENYSLIAQNFSKWEESHYSLAMYYDRIANTCNKAEQKAKTMSKIIQSFSESLKYGSRHMYESMPKLLTIWFDLGNYAISSANFNKSKKEFQRYQEIDSIYQKYFSVATECIKKLIKDLQPYLFYIAFSQLISRICHPNVEVSDQIANIIVLLLIKYPNQSMWLLLGVLLNDKNKIRQDKCINILKRVISQDKNMNSLIMQYNHFGQILCKICNYKNKKEHNKFDLYEVVPELRKCINNNFKVIVPYQCFMNVQLHNRNEDSNLPFHPFKSNCAYIYDIKSVATVLLSLAQPKKISIVGSDGITYIMMCKPKDDLRKDFRAMEFNNLVNRHLQKDSETRKRNLFIKTYTVVPLSHDCGLVEWINNLESYRSIVLHTYVNHFPNFRYSSSEIQKIYPNKNLSLHESVIKFEQNVLPKFPPIFNMWFVNQFTNPTEWYSARINYVRSCAVMSIVGYIIGLGDRHGENILIHSQQGHIVHVDFNILFNKGEELEVPEIVPFRLTHNMIDAMGPTGYEGIYRKTCEATLRIMHEQKEALMSALKPFVYDPLLEWDCKKVRENNLRKNLFDRNINDQEVLEVSNDVAVANINKISDRLSGILRHEQKPTGLPISVNYQVSNLIEQATSIKNLCKMYIGWGSFI